MLDSGEPGCSSLSRRQGRDLTVNRSSMGYHLVGLQRDGLLRIEAIRVDPVELVEAGEYDLEPLFLRIGVAVAKVGR
jgi:circadian clock protein KaiC